MRIGDNAGGPGRPAEFPDHGSQLPTFDELIAAERASGHGRAAKELQRILASVPPLEVTALRDPVVRRLLVESSATGRLMASSMVIVHRRKFDFEGFPFLAKAVEGDGPLWVALRALRVAAGEDPMEIMRSKVTPQEAGEIFKVQMADLSARLREIRNHPAVAAARCGADVG